MHGVIHLKYSINNQQCHGQTPTTIFSIKSHSLVVCMCVCLLEYFAQFWSLEYIMKETMQITTGG